MKHNNYETDLCAKGDGIKYTFKKDTEINKIYLTFDSNLNRNTHNMHCLFPLKPLDRSVPQTLVKSYSIIGENSSGERFEIAVNDSHQRFVTHNVSWKVKNA